MNPLLIEFIEDELAPSPTDNLSLKGAIIALVLLISAVMITIYAISVNFG